MFSILILLLLSITSITDIHGFGLSSHVLDTSIGSPVENFQINLSYNDNDEWKLLMDNQFTDVKGRVEFNITKCGVYKLFFNTEQYYGERTFYPFIEIVFKITNETENYHVPITLSPYGYSTYKGSK